MSLTGRIFDISRGCVDDGPGLRTVIFLKGCRLSCPWCQNIEGISFDPEVSYDAVRCIRCRRCREACPREWLFDVPDAWRKGCRVLAACVEVCPAHARRLVGRSYGVEGLTAEVCDEAAFFSGTGGGVTFSGGEPLAQPEFLFACAEALRSRGTHIAVETAGFWPSNLAPDLLRHADLLLFDLKHVDGKKIRRVIRGNAGVILENLTVLLDSDVPMEIRITVVPGFNDSADDLRAIARRMTSFRRVPPVRLLPYHRLAVSKQDLLGRRYPYAFVPHLSAERLSEAADHLTREGLPVRRDRIDDDTPPGGPGSRSL